MSEGSQFDQAPRRGQEPSHEIMQARIERILASPELRKSAEDDFVYTLEQLGLDFVQAKELQAYVFKELGSGDALETIEARVLQHFKTIHVERGGETRNLVEVLDGLLVGRADTIFEQVHPDLKDLQGEAVDYGAGDGRVTQRLHEAGVQIRGFDVRPYKSREVTVSVDMFDGSRLPCPDRYFEAAVLTNVLHHEADNEKILQELNRAVSKRIVIIETVPFGTTEEECEKDKERTFMNDYVYNRLFHSANVPVPGTFESAEGWKKRFAKLGWKIAAEEDLGVDQPTIKDYHYKLVFERAA